MSYPLKNDFKPGIPIANQLTADWCNTVANFLNNLRGDGTVRVSIPPQISNTSPVTIMGYADYGEVPH